MRVAIDTGSSGGGHGVRGIGVHTNELLRALEQESKRVKEYKIVIDGVDFTKTNLSKYDLVHYTVFQPFFLTLPAKKPAKKVVVTIHDLIPLIYPKHYPSGIKGRFRFFEQRRRLRNVDAIITISETSKKDICRFLKINPDRVHVVHLAPKEIFKSKVPDSMYRYIESKYKLPKKFVLYVGDINYNKNIPGLIKAAKLSRIPLVIVGKNALKIEELTVSNHPEHAHLKEIVNDLGRKDIMRLGFVPDEDLAVIYKLATLYCQPSFYEGFGLVILEAQASGCPVVATHNQAHVEVGDEACLFTDSNDFKDLSNKITQMSENSEFRTELVEKGQKNNSKYSWEKTAKGTLDVYKKVL